MNCSPNAEKTLHNVALVLDCTALHQKFTKPTYFHCTGFPCKGFTKALLSIETLDRSRLDNLSPCVLSEANSPKLAPVAHMVTTDNLKIC